MNSNDLKMTSKEPSPLIERVKPNRSKKSQLKGGSFNENLETNDTYLDEILKTNNSDSLYGNSNANYL